MAAPVAGRGGRGAARRPAGVHAGGRGDLRAGEPGGGGRNVLAGPAVGPATVLGLAGGLLGLVWDPLGRLAGTLASWCVAWIISVAEHGARLPAAAIGWGTGAVSLAVLSVLVVVLALAAPRLLRRPATGIVCCLVLVVAVLVRPADLGWPPTGWVLVACDVGQGDALVLNAGRGSAVVVDAGPDPVAVDQCLDRLDVEPDPAPRAHPLPRRPRRRGVRRPRRPGGGRRLGDPGPRPAPGRRRGARGWARSARFATDGATVAYGAVTLQALWPPAATPTRGPGDGSTANDASVVLLVEAAGPQLLLTGDIEPDGQAVLAGLLPGLRRRRAEDAAPRQPAPGRGLAPARSRRRSSW